MKKILALSLAVLLSACAIDFHGDDGRPVTDVVDMNVGE